MLSVCLGICYLGLLMVAARNSQEKEINRGGTTSRIVFTGVKREFQTISKSIKHQKGTLLRCYESKDAHKLVPCDGMHRNNVHQEGNYTSRIMKEKRKCIIGYMLPAAIIRTLHCVIPLQLKDLSHGHL